MTHPRLWRLVVALAIVAVPAAVATLDSPAAAGPGQGRGPQSRCFRRVATFPVFRNTDIDTEGVAEIIAASNDGKTVIYTDGAGEALGFVDISDPSDPHPDGTVALGGEPTSVGVVGKYALACVNTSDDFVNTSGELVVIDMNTRTVKRTIQLGGQPDSIAISHDQRYAVIAIENERDEDLGSGEPPQAPAGFVVIVDVTGNPNGWSLTNVSLVGVPDLFPGDPEPEFISINKHNVAAVTMQENNHVALIDLKTAAVIDDWSCGSVDLDEIDVDDNDLIEQVDGLVAVPREPDALTWIGDDKLATADEGDLYGGGRGFTIFEADGSVAWAAGNTVEHLNARFGHYPEGRSDNKGAEPEGIAYGRYGNDDLLFVGCERSSIVLVYEMDDDEPVYKQVLPATIGPEGLLPIPGRNLLVVSGEEEILGGYRASITIYERVQGTPIYPTIESLDRDSGEPIAWAALSALAAHPSNADMAYTIHDSFFKAPRIYTLDMGVQPVQITGEIVLTDADGVVTALDDDVLESLDVLDAEGLSIGANGEFWIASEGVGSVDDPGRPVETNDLLLRVTSDGTVLDAVTLPDLTNARQRRFGLEGCAYVDAPGGPYVYVCFQREWVNDPAGLIRIGRYDVGDDEWRFFYYPRDDALAGTWVGLSEIVALSDTCFAVIERDNQADVYATNKRIYAFSVEGLTPLEEAPEGVTPSFPEVTKVLVRDILPDLKSAHGPVLDKPEGLMVLADGDAVFHTDNDGVDDHSGETQLQRLGGIFDGALEALED